MDTASWVNRRAGRFPPEPSHRMTTTAAQPATSIKLQVWAALGDPRVRTAIALGGLVAAVGGGLLLATSDHLVDPVAFGTQLCLMVIGTVAAALVWIKRRPENRVGPLLLAFAFVTAGLALEGADDEILHSLGVALEPLFFLLAYLVVFAFPEGRTGRAERLLLAGMALYFLVAFVPWLFFSPVVSGGGPLFGCNASCPANGLMIADRPNIAASFGSDLAWAVIALLTATIVLLAVRLATASRPRRRTLLPVYVPALVLSVPLLGVPRLRGGRAPPGRGHPVGSRLDRDRRPRRDAVRVPARDRPGERLRGQRPDAAHGADRRQSRARRACGEIVAGALDDPSVELAFRVDGDDGFVDSRGEPVAGVTARDGRATSLVGRQGETVAAIWHDPALNTDPELVNAASQAVLLALENGRLDAELRTTTDELAASRARNAAVGAAERRRVERDLHDGAQQQLVALQIKVALARELAPSDSEVAARLADVGYGLEDVLSELREFAHGAAPPLLRNAGLSTALASAAQRSVPPAAFVADGVARYPDEIETAVYFCCLEALQNVRKHAGRGPTRRSASPSERMSCASRSSTTASAARSNRVRGAGHRPDEHERARLRAPRHAGRPLRRGARHERPRAASRWRAG